MAKPGTEARADSSGSPRAYEHRGKRSSVRRVVPRHEGPRPLAPAEMFAHLSAIVDACDDAFVSASLDGTTVLWNPCAETLFGYSAAEAVGRPISLLLPPGRAEEPERLLTRIAHGERIDQYETVRIRKDGSHIDVSLSAFPVRDATGTVIGAAVIARDITEQKRTERELHRWREQLQAIAQGVDDAVVVRGPGGQIVYANDNAARLLGFASVSELIATPTARTHERFQFYTESGQVIPASRLPGVLALQDFEMPPTVLRFRLLHTGEERWAIVKAVPIRDDNGQVQFAASIFTDITQRKQAEEALKVSEMRFQTFMDNSPIVAFIKDEGGRFVYVNPQFERAFQTTAASVLGVSDTEIVPPDVARQIHLDDKEVLATGKLKQITEVIPAPDGTEHHWLTFKFPMSLPGDRRLIAGGSVEITGRVHAEEALKESEARFQAFMHNSPIVAYMKDEAGRVVFLNHAWEQLFGIPIAEALGKDDFQLQPPELADKFHAADMEVLKSGQAKVMAESITAGDGTLRHWMTFKFPIVLPSGAHFVGGASVEITERVRAEQELQRYASRLQSLSRQLIEAQEAERRRISRDLHDQVGQSLTAIKIDLQIAQHQAASTSTASSTAPGDVQADMHPPKGSAAGQEGHAEFAERLGKGIDMVERTIQQVREFSLDLRPSILDDLGLPSALLWYAEEQARRAGFQTELAIEHLPTRLSPELEITCFRVAQEAITNVVRHAHAQHVSLELRRSGENIVLTVSDDGAGFDPLALAADTPEPADSGADRAPGKASNKVADGRGRTRGAREMARIKTLGLAGMNERVLLMRGSLSIDSAPGTGTVVRAVFPLGAFSSEESTHS